MADVHVKGLADLQKFLDQLPAKLEANVMRGGLRAGAKVIQFAAKQNVHSVSGALARGIKISTGNRAGVVMARIKATGEEAYIANFVEFGTAAHWISVRESARPGRMTRRGRWKTFSISTLNRMAKKGSLQIGGNFIGASVLHPGARAKPFMRPALDAHARNAIVAIAEYIKKRLETKHGLDTSDVSIGAEDD